MTPDKKLTAHFSFYELTQTSNADLQAANRELTTEQAQKLYALALHCENIRRVCGDVPLRIHSGYRSPALNGATHGSSKTSQHPLCEAVDFDVPGQALEASFGALLMAARTGRIKFGQLILERAKRGPGNADAVWVHCSVPGSLPPEKVGQVLKMTAGDDGVPRYELVCKLDFPAETA